MVLTGGEEVWLELAFETSTEDAVGFEREILAAARAALVELGPDWELVPMKEVVGMDWMELVLVDVVGDAADGVEGVAVIDVPTLKEESGCGY